MDKETIVSDFISLILNNNDFTDEFKAEILAYVLPKLMLYFESIEE